MTLIAVSYPAMIHPTYPPPPPSPCIVSIAWSPSFSSDTEPSPTRRLTSRSRNRVLRPCEPSIINAWRLHPPRGSQGPASSREASSILNSMSDRHERQDPMIRKKSAPFTHIIASDSIGDGLLVFLHSPACMDPQLFHSTVPMLSKGILLYQHMLDVVPERQSSWVRL